MQDSLLPVLKIGVTLAIFNLSGNIPLFREVLKICKIGREISLNTCLTMEGLISSNPGLDSAFKDLKADSSSSIDKICSSNKLKLPDKKFWGGILQFIFLARLGTTFTKKLLKELAICFWFVIKFPPTFILFGRTWLEDDLLEDDYQ